MNFTHIFQGFQLYFRLLFIVLFLGIIPWKGVSRFIGGIIFKCGGEDALWRASFLMGGGVSKKIVGWGGPHPPPTMGNPVNRGCFLTLGNTKCSQTLTKQTNAKFNML